MEGGSDQAGFVQATPGQGGRLEPDQGEAADTTMLHEMRPEIIGGTLAIEADGSFIETVAFRDEDSAREGEKTPPPPEVALGARVDDGGRQVLRPPRPLVRVGLTGD